MLQGSQSGLENGHHTEEASSADVDPSAFSEPQHQQITAPASANRKSADQAESDSEQQTMPLQAAATLAAKQPGTDQQHAEVIELQRQRSLEIEAHLAQVRLSYATASRQLNSFRTALRAATCRSFGLRSACSRIFVSPSGLWAALTFLLVPLRMSGQL